MSHKNALISKSERGQSLTELAISLTFMLILLAGVVDIGRAFFTYITLRDAAQEAAVYGSFEPTNCTGITDRAQDTSNKPFDLSSASVSINIIQGGIPVPCVSATPVPADQIQVSVSYNDFQITMPFIGSLIGKQKVPISASIKDTILSVPTPTP
jgi:Flp pilus assembly protein TadG